MSELNKLEDTRYTKPLTYDNKLADNIFLNMVSDTDIVISKIDPVKADVFTGDFHGLLKDINVTEDLLNITTRLNGLISSSEYNGDFQEIKLLSEAFVEKIKMLD